jgi:hypothetical protein
MRRGKAVHCRICSQLRPYIRANAVRAFDDRAGGPVSIEPRLVPRIVRGSRLRAGVEPVSMRVVLCVSVILAGMIAVALALTTGPAAAADCVTDPNRDAPTGQHWYFHLDHATDRKCWYLHATVPAGSAEAPAMELQSVHPQRRQAVAAEPPRRPAAAAPAAQSPRRQVAAPQPPAQRSEADEAALYLEFLRWKEQHRGER